MFIVIISLDSKTSFNIFIFPVLTKMTFFGIYTEKNKHFGECFSVLFWLKKMWRQNDDITLKKFKRQTKIFNFLMFI
jgi:hypothetical protein